MSTVQSQFCLGQPFPSELWENLRTLHGCGPHTYPPLGNRSRVWVRVGVGFKEGVGGDVAHNQAWSKPPWSGVKDARFLGTCLPSPGLRLARSLKEAVGGQKPQKPGLIWIFDTSFIAFCTVHSYPHRHSGNRYLTSLPTIGQHLSPWTCKLSGSRDKFHFECKLHFPMSFLAKFWH